MIIDFDDIEPTVLKNFKGGDGEVIANVSGDDLNRIALNRMAPGSSIGEHRHETNSEIIYAISGEAAIVYDGEDARVRAGQCHYCPKGHGHIIINDGTEDFVFIHVVPQQ